MARSKRSHGFSALKIEGGILPPEFPQTVAALQAKRQSGADYGLSRSLSIKEELARYWRIANDLHSQFAERRARSDVTMPRASVAEWLGPLLSKVFGYEDITVTKGVARNERFFKLTHHAWGNAVPLLLLPGEFGLDKADPRLGAEGRRQSPHALMQEYLNADEAALWGIVSNGAKLRLLRDNVSLTRPAYIEADLELIFTEELYSDFAALWLIAHASRLQPVDENPARCIMESWRAEAHETGERIREELRDGVTDCLRRFGIGFLQHPANGNLRNALENGTLSPERYFQQLLRLVYRLLFLFTAEERNLLHAPDATDEQRAVFSEGYALSRSRDRVLRRRHYDRNQDLWQGLQISFRALATGVEDLGLPALDGLFRADQCPDLDRAAITNEDLLEGVRTIAYFRAERNLARINYRDMDTEELGSVYESLLELRPVINPNVFPWTFAFISDGGDEKVKGSARKLTGSYYTPPSLVSELIKSTLEPVIANAVESNPQDPRTAILKLKVLDPACGSGHFLLAAARRLAQEIVRVESSGSDSEEAARQRALREVVRHCIYGVDRNPLAVELCKAALWMETVEPGKPLTFLDSHIIQGDSLVGVIDPEIIANGIPTDAYKPLTGDDKSICQSLKKSNRQPEQRDLFDENAVLEVAVSSVDLDSMPEETLDDIERKRSAWESAQQDDARALEKLRADLFVGAFFAPKKSDTHAFVPRTGDIHSLSGGMPRRAEVEDFVDNLANRHYFLHWHLAFAEVMSDGGFDAVLGNPPWERIKLSEQEFFASHSQEIASAPTKAARDRLIQQLNRNDASSAEKTLHHDFLIAKREAEAISQFVRTGGRFPLTGVGDVNTYAVFAELFLQLLNPRGSAGLIVPTGIAVDHSTKAFFKHLVSQKRLVSLFDFENREAVFSGVHRSYKFCLLTLGGKDYSVSEAEFAFFLHQAEQLKERERRFTLSAEDFSLFNPNTRTCPIFRTRRDMEIARKMYQRAGVFWKEANEAEEEENPWGVKFSTMFHMSNDSGFFRTRLELEEEGWKLEGNDFIHGDDRYVPLYEAKLFHQYDHRFATFKGVSDLDIKEGKGKTQPMTAAEKSDPQSVSLPRYWVAEEEMEKRLDKSKIDIQLGTEQNRTEQNRTEQNRTEQNRTEQNRTEQNRTEQNYWMLSQSWLAVRSPADHQLNQRENGSFCHDSTCAFGPFWSNGHSWIILFRDIARSTDYRTAIFVATRGTAVSNKAPILNIDYGKWLQAFRGITTSTNERTLLSDTLPESAVGNSAPIIDYRNARAVASALVLANMNSLPLDWAARFSVGGVNMNFFIVKQLPVLPPEAFLERSVCGHPWVQLVVPRVLELTYTSNELNGFAADLGYEAPPIPWNEERRHCLRCELDAIFAQMYGLERSDLEWILDAQAPSSSFPALKQNELGEFGEYRTLRYVLHAFDLLSQGENPELYRSFE